MRILITCRSLTHAQRAAQLLNRSGISAAVVKTPQELSAKGCGYAVSLYRHTEEAVSILRGYNMLEGRVFARKDDGSYGEL